MRFTISTLFLLLSLTACPRGETNTLDEVLSSARQRFDSFTGTQVANIAQGQLKTVAMDLKSFVESSDSAVQLELAGKLATQLEGLVDNASFTVRPALSEVIKQLRTFAATQIDSPGEMGAKAKLLAARTYWALAGELETTGFRL